MKSICVWRAAVLLCVILSQELASAQTEVSGTQNGTWTLENSPYVLVGDVFVNAPDTLTIDPGVVVLADGYHRITVEGGELVAVGTPEAPIMMTAMNQTQGWGGIRLFGASDESRFEYCTFEYAKNFGPNLESRGGAIRIEQCSPTIRFNEFRHNSSHNDNFNGGGGAVYVHLSSAIVANNIMFTNSADNGGAIRAGDLGTPIIRGTHLVGNIAHLGGGV
ncbi:MAG: hypothetical protein IID36_14305, partial [Planctomycetes bacterium]|nr:hypothetical protein [Planctomycetota bacterium]